MEVSLNRNSSFLILFILIGTFLFPALHAEGTLAAPAWGEELYSVAQAAEQGSERDTAGETAQSSQNAKQKLTGFTDRITDTWDRISNWVSEKFHFFKSKVDAVFGFEKGEGPQAFFGTVFYFIVLMVLLFVLAFIYNIIRDMFTGIKAKTKPKPSYRKKR